MENNLTIIIPTYSGVETIDEVVRSISSQTEAKSIHLIFVIDGPNEELKKIVASVDKNSFKSVNIKQLEINKGRFIARYEGALLANTPDLLFIDDRTEMTGGYIKAINKLSQRHKIIISNILEKSQPNFISRTLYVIRKKLYKNWGKQFQPYDITESNFDKSAKGTAGLYVGRDVFLKAAKEFMRGTITRGSNDDTKLLKFMLQDGPLHKSPLPTLLYLPRASWRDEMVHIYKRGPMFVDYYLNRHSPYIRHFQLLYIMTVVMIICLIIFPLVTLLLLSTCIATVIVGAGLFVTGAMRYMFGAGVVIVAGAFMAGIYSGTFSKIIDKLTASRK